MNDDEVYQKLVEAEVEVSRSEVRYTSMEVLRGLQEVIADPRLLESDHDKERPCN